MNKPLKEQNEKKGLFTSKRGPVLKATKEVLGTKNQNS